MVEQDYDLLSRNAFAAASGVRARDLMGRLRCHTHLLCEPWRRCGTRHRARDSPVPAGGFVLP